MVLSPAWSFAQSVQGTQSAGDAIRRTGLDWSVDLEPVQLASGRVVPSTFATVRSDTGAPLATVGKRYTPYQNAEAFALLDGLAADGSVEYQKAGALAGGGRVFMVAKVPGALDVVRGDALESYMVLVNSHDGTGALRIFPTTMRIVCANMLRRAENLAGERVISIRHTASIGQRAHQAREVLAGVMRRTEAQAEEARVMARRSLTGNESRGYFESLFPVKAPRAGLLSSILEGAWNDAEVVGDLLAGARQNAKELTERTAKKNREILSRILANYENERNRLPGIEHSAWSAYNAVSEYVDHGRKSRGSSQSERAENRFESVLFGSGNDLKQEAYSAALALTN